MGAQWCRHAKMGPEVPVRWGRWRSSELVRWEKEWGSKRKNYRRVWGISDEVRTRSLRHRRGGNDFASLQASGMDERKWERERGVLRETEEMGRRERRVLNFEIIRLNGRLRSIKLQPCNTFWYCLRSGSVILKTNPSPGTERDSFSFKNYILLSKWQTSIKCNSQKNKTY